VNEIEAHPHEVAHMIEQADAHGVTTREEFMLSTHANPRQIDEMIRGGSINGLEAGRRQETSASTEGRPAEDGSR
jgi:hypothetical protein